MNEKGREDQRKFREVDQEESYFDCDDDDDDDETVMERQQKPETEMHKAPRMFSLSQTQHARLEVDESKIYEKPSDGECI
jgi:hypothetical protein